MSSTQHPSVPRPRRRWALATAMVGLAALAACTPAAPNPDPGPTGDSPARVATELAAGLGRKDVTPLEFVGATGAQVNELYQPVVRGMGPLRPQVSVGPLNAQPTSATVTLRYAWTFPGIRQPWTYDTQAQLVKEAGRWKTTWQPSLVAPELDGSNRLTQKRLGPERGELLGADGEPIVSLRPVVRIGIDKSQVSAEAAQASADRLARLVKITPKSYAARVAAAGSKAFVDAIVLRATARDRPSNSSVFAIPGALPIETEQMLAPNRDFARSVIGTVGEATKEVIDEASGAVVAGDQVGLAGLQKRYDAQLRGTPGVQVQLVAARTATTSASPSPSPSASSTPKPMSVFEIKPVAGRPLTTTLDIPLQNLAEATLATTKPSSAIVALRPSTGAILAAANGPGANGQAVATTGQFPPGSTFKVVSALALLRAGLTPSSAVTCPATVTVDGKEFKNYNDYPSNRRGRIDLRTAVAQSCNTAFIGQRAKLSGSDLSGAAGSLGVGIDYDVGFPSFFGSVPADNATGRAAALIGQGKVQASPMAMAAVAGSVSAGRTVIPHLVAGQQAKSKGKPLSAAEATQLRAMMRAAVTEGSGQILGSLEPPAVIAKTGTAEYGAQAPYRTHAWMVASQGDLAVAVFVSDGQSGSRTAGPLLKAFLSGAQ